MSDVTYNKLVEELKDKTDIKLGNLASGEYEAKRCSKKLQKQLDALNEQLSERIAFKLLLKNIFPYVLFFVESIESLYRL